MQHSALRRRTTPAVMRHRVEAAKSSASLRPPVPPTAQTVTGLSEPFFVSPPQPVVPLVAFADAAQPLPSALPLPPRSRHSPTAHSAEAPSLALTTNAQQPRTTPHRRPIAKATQRENRKWGHWARNAPLIRDFPQRFRASPPALQNTPQSHRRSAHPAASWRAKTPSVLTFFAFRFASLPIPPYLCGDTCPQNFAPSVVKWPWLGFFSSPCCRNWW